MDKKIITYKWTIVSLSLIIACVALIIISKCIELRLSSMILEELGAVCFGLGILIFIQENFLKNQFKDLFSGSKKYYENGFISFDSKRNIDNIKNEIQNSKKEIIIVSLTAYNTIYSLKDDIYKTCLQHPQCNVKFLLINENSSIIQIWEKSLGINGIKEEILNSKNLISMLSSDLDKTPHIGKI